MKLSVSLPDDDVAVLDAYARQHALASRSAVVQRAIQLLRDAELEDQYEVAINEWYDSGEAEVWEVTTADGLNPDPVWQGLYGIGPGADGDGQEADRAAG